MVATDKLTQVREAAEADLVTFIRLVHPQRVIGAIHEELCSWITSPERSSHKLVLLPRDHGKSAYAAYYVAWRIVKDPTIRVLYISSQHRLAMKQLFFIKNILDSVVVRRYWPQLLNLNEGQREKWTEFEIAVDDPRRKAEAIRDPTVFTAGLKTGITGLHFDLSILDDVVTRENSTEEGRELVKSQYSLLASIEAADAQQLAVGTRYDPNDLYSNLQSMSVQEFNENGDIFRETMLYDTFERSVEDAGDGTGEFLWPRQQRHDGKWFGFNQEILAKKRAQYLDKTQFQAQYYNNPNDSSSAPIKRDYFRYYDKNSLKRVESTWTLNGTPLYVSAAIDFAFSRKKEADYTSIVVVGTDPESNHYVLDIKRFKTDKIKEYYDAIFETWNKWGYRELNAEVSVAQGIIVRDLRDNYITKNSIPLRILEYRPTSKEGSKVERILSTLQPRYEEGKVYHYKGGNCQVLEEELVMQRPPHDDVKDGLASAVSIAKRPLRNGMFSASKGQQLRQGKIHPRFGGIR